MSLTKFLASLLLLLAFGCRTTMEQGRAYVPSPPVPPPPAKPQVPQYEVDAVNTLLALVPTTSGPYNARVNFSATDCRYSLQFAGVIRCDPCNVAYCRVTLIDFSNWGLTGQIPPEIGNLSQLVSLDLKSNMLYGSLPSFFSNLSQLQELHLDHNNLEGSLKVISEMRSLQILNLHNNFFDGPIPPEFGAQLPKLQQLSIYDNLLSGKIPITLGNMTSLLKLYLDNNQFTGKLTPYLGNLSSLQEMHLMNNNLSGPIPLEFGKLENLLNLNIQGNSISGRIPEHIGNWQSIQVLSLIGNNFEGPLPANISALTHLTELYANNLPAANPGGSLFPNISRATKLDKLELRNCSLTGEIPDFLWKELNLDYVDLSFNNLTGEIPAERFGQQSNARSYVFLRRNNLSGPIPKWMLDSSVSLDVSENRFTNKSISSNITANKNLFECCSDITDESKKWQQVQYYCANDTIRYDQLYINCGGNETLINGIRYKADVFPIGTSTFFLSRDGAWGYSSMGLYDDSKYIALETCNITVEDAPLYVTARLAPISLKYYGFCLKPHNYIVRLHFAEIGWDSSEVRDSDPNLKKRRVFDVDIQNQKVLTDFNIEQEAGGVRKSITKEFNVSVTNSRLEIHLYWTGKGSTSFPTSTYGPLISAISVSPVPKEHRKTLSSGIIFAISGSGLLVALIIIGLCWRFGWLGKRRDVVELLPGNVIVFKFKQIKDATDGFAPANQIGQGGFGAVYWGKLPNGDEIAVKQLSKNSRQGVSEFIAEIGTIMLKHPNLITPRGCCADEHQLLLVYKYMENNSLAHALFGPDDVKAKLDWNRRVHICLDVAKGLAYLHEDSDLLLIHGDIKPSNILLDKDFNAKISDFGFARRHERPTKNARPDERETTPTNSQVKGTQSFSQSQFSSSVAAYVAPECTKAEYSPKVDVYSFGILTLEIISGQQSSTPSAKGQTIFLLEKAYECLRHRNPTALVDSSLLGSQYDDKVAERIIYLAMQCIHHDPNQRPTMSDVVKILEGKKKIENILAPIAVDFSQSSHSASTSVEGASDSTLQQRN